jgi:hypothetical protein
LHNSTRTEHFVQAFVQGSANDREALREFLESIAAWS